MKEIYSKSKNVFWGTLGFINPGFRDLVYKWRIYVKYVFSGGSAAFINLATLAFLTEIIGIHYLLSSALAFLIAFIASFLLQKVWTFGDMDMGQAKRQMVLYLIVALINLAINTGIVFALVEWVGVWYFLAQIVAGAIIAFYTFLIYRRLIFKKNVSSN